MASKKAKRGRKHPGVVLMKANEARRIGHRARYTNPDTGKAVFESLDRALTTLEQRERWAAQKSKELARRKLELEAGAVRATGTALNTAIKRYYDDHPQLRDRTREIYQTASDKLEAWAKGMRVRTADELTRGRLLAFRAELIREPKRVALKGKNIGRGKRAPSALPRSPVTVNQELRSLRTVLGYVRDLDLLPMLSHDDLRRALKRLPVAADRIEFLTAVDCRRLLEATLRHDVATYAATREEHAGLRAAGTTLRYPSIAGFTFFVLLTGMRVGEALSLDWKQVDLEALDHEGRAVGEIHLGTAQTKTKHARTVGLDVSPALRKLLAAMKLASGGKGRVFALSRDEADSAAQRLQSTYGAPAFTWQTLRRTCGTFLTNAAGIFGAASAYRSARQLGHSVAVAEKVYLGVLRGVPRDARTLEAAMQIEDIAAQIAAQLGSAPRGVRRVRAV